MPCSIASWMSVSADAEVDLEALSQSGKAGAARKPRPSAFNLTWLSEIGFDSICVCLHEKYSAGAIPQGARRRPYGLALCAVRLASVGGGDKRSYSSSNFSISEHYLRTVEPSFSIDVVSSLSNWHGLHQSLMPPSLRAGSRQKGYSRYA